VYALQEFRELLGKYVLLALEHGLGVVEVVNGPTNELPGPYRIKKGDSLVGKLVFDYEIALSMERTEEGLKEYETGTEEGNAHFIKISGLRGAVLGETTLYLISEEYQAFADAVTALYDGLAINVRVQYVDELPADPPVQEDPWAPPPMPDHQPLEVSPDLRARRLEAGKRFMERVRSQQAGTLGEEAPEGWYDVPGSDDVSVSEE
jgi:hypothetical protein